MKDIVIHVRVEDRVHQALARKSEQTGATISELIRRAIKASLPVRKDAS